MRRLVPLAAPLVWVGGGALALWLAFGHGFANYDTLYALVWGGELARGEPADFGAPLTPTPHPLATLLGVLTSPLGDGAETVVIALAFVSLAAVGYLTYRLGAAWFGAGVGLVAAAIVLTREPILSFGVRAYVDVPFVALALAALLVETRRPRAGLPVLALLVPAGLLRPEAWLLSFAYLGYLAVAGGRGRRELAGLAAVAAAGPALWAISDLIVTGDALHSLSGTRENAETLNRPTGLDDLPAVMPRRLGEILREPVLIGAAGGGLLALALLRRRALLGAAAGVAAVVAFAVLAAAGLPIITRYLMLAATILAIFAGAGALGWLRLPPGHRWRGRWRAFGALVLALLAVYGSEQYERLDDLQQRIAAQERIRGDLHELVRAGAFESGDGLDCGPITVPNHRPVPLLALWLERRPSEIESAQLVRPEAGYYLDPASAEIERLYTLDKNDPGELTAEVPRGFERAAENRSWRVFRRC